MTGEMATWLHGIGRKLVQRLVVYINTRLCRHHLGTSDGKLLVGLREILSRKHTGRRWIRG